MALTTACVVNASGFTEASDAGTAQDAGQDSSDAGKDTGDAADGSAATLSLVSSAFQDNGTLPAQYTCDGVGNSPPFAWTGPPENTAELAVLMTTVAPDGMKWNWVLYHIPPTVTSIPEGATDIGTAGLTSDGPLLKYYPPCSQGPGAKLYSFTVYALSGAPALGEQVTGPILTSAMDTLTLASSTVNVTYTR